MPANRLTPAIERRTLPAARLWQDDLRQVATLIREINANALIYADDYRLDDIIDLAELPEQRVRRFEIATVEGTEVHLSISPAESFITVKNPDLAAFGTLDQVERIFVKRRRFNFGYCGGSVVIIALAIFAFTASDTANQKVALIPLMIGILAGMLSAWVSLRGFARPRTLIHTRTRIEAPTFWQRKRDDIWLAFGTAVVTLPVGAYLGYRFTR